jgi:hypothetical protein
MHHLLITPNAKLCFIFSLEFKVPFYATHEER